MATCKKIVWDTNREYIISNPNNYSWNTSTYASQFKYFVEGSNLTSYSTCIYQTARIYFNYSQPNWQGQSIAFRFSDSNCGNSNQAWKNSSDNNMISSWCNAVPELYNNRFAIWRSPLPSIVIANPWFGKALRIIDGGVITYHQISNINSVQIIEFNCCGSNELNCGDCCADCDTIFNSISGIRKILSRI